ncbi:MAG: tetratricopeptide repeat protein [Gammaproteobacteria bacterium]|nr:tetratricopeptide repeat protein [Gammaproteobacteria bacterium]
MSIPNKIILILAANPVNTPRLRLDKEIREISEGLARSSHRDNFKLKQHWAVRPLDLRRAMLDSKPAIVHFCGHGEGGIAFEADNGEAVLAGAEALADLFKLFSQHVECVLLNACYSEVQADAISKHIFCVIGMNQAIGDQAAVEFAAAFYDALGAGESCEFAYQLGCNAIHIAGIPEHLTPVLKLNKALQKNNASAVHEPGQTPDVSAAKANAAESTHIQRAGGDVVGSSKQQAGADIIGRDKHTYTTIHTNQSVLIIALAVLVLGIALVLWLGSDKSNSNTDKGNIYITQIGKLTEEEWKHLTQKLGMPDTALNNLGEILGKKEKEIDPQNLDKEFRHMAQEHKDLLARLNAGDDESQQQIYAAVKQGDYQSAKKLLSQKAKTYKTRIKEISADDPESPELDDIRFNAAQAEAALGHLARIELDYEKAQRYFKEAIERIPATIQSRKLQLARADYLDNSGWMYFKQGKYKKAQKKLQEARKLREEHLDAGDPDFNTSYNHLAETYREAAEYPKADALYRKLIQGLQSRLRYVSAEEKTSLLLQKAEALNNLGQLHSEYMNEYQKSLEYYRKSLAIRQELLEPETLKIAESLNNIGTALHYQGQYANAQEYYQKALAIKRNILSEEHPSIAFTLHNIGVMYSKQKQYKKAAAAYNEALKIKKKKLGKQHKSVAATYEQIAHIAQDEGDYATALQYYGDALKIREQNLSPEHLELGNGYFNFAALYYEQKQ